MAPLCQILENQPLSQNLQAAEEKTQSLVIENNAILQAQQQTVEKQEIGSQVKLGLALLGLGFILPFALEFISREFFQIRHGVTLDSVIVVVCLVYILLVGQYLWRHRQTMPHLAIWAYWGGLGNMVDTSGYF